MSYQDSKHKYRNLWIFLEGTWFAIGIFIGATFPIPTWFSSHPKLWIICVFAVMAIDVPLTAKVLRIAFGEGPPSGWFMSNMIDLANSVEASRRQRALGYVAVVLTAKMMFLLGLLLGELIPIFVGR